MKFIDRNPTYSQGAPFRVPSPDVLTGRGSARQGCCPKFQGVPHFQKLQNKLIAHIWRQLHFPDSFLFYTLMTIVNTKNSSQGPQGNSKHISVLFLSFWIWRDQDAVAQPPYRRFGSGGAPHSFSGGSSVLGRYGLAYEVSDYDEIVFNVIIYL